MSRALKICCFFQIVIEGVVGSSYRGDIAIDDVAMAAGTCGQGDTFILFTVMDTVFLRL